MTDDPFKNQTDTLPDALRPRAGFLIAALLFSVCAAAAYFYQEEIIAASPGEGATPFAILLVALVLVALILLLCYRMPRLGNRLLGYDVMLTKDDPKAQSEGYHYTGTFKSETAADVKRAASRRLQARQSRRKYARATRDLQSDGGD